jgi:carboxylesterase type B
MFYIHGGDFMRGASNLFPGHVMAAFYEVVVVTINYRLGALGKLKFHMLFLGLLNDCFSVAQII